MYWEKQMNFWFSKMPERRGVVEELLTYYHNNRNAMNPGSISACGE